MGVGGAAEQIGDRPPFAKHPRPEDEAVARALKRRELLVADGGFRRLRAPLMRRWIVEQFG